MGELHEKISVPKKQKLLTKKKVNIYNAFIIIS